MEAMKLKIDKGIELIRSSYYSNSILSELVRIEESFKTEEEFKAWYIAHYIPKEWFTRSDIYADHIFHEYGRNMALGETKSIRDLISESKEVERNEYDKIDAGFILDQLTKSLENGMEPSILFIPISYYGLIVSELWKKHLDRWSAHSIEVMGKKIRLKWSNKYMPFNEIMIVDPGYGKLYLKSPLNDRLKVEIKPSDRFGKMGLFIRVIHKFEILDPNKIRIIVPKSSGEESTD